MVQPRPEISLDPENWDSARATAHRMIDDAIDHLAGLRERHVWQEPPASALAAFHAPLPLGPTPLDGIYDDLRKNFFPYPMGNVHPRFFGWYMGGSNLTGALGDFLAAIDGSNLGGGFTAAAEIDKQVVSWLGEMMGFPEGRAGTLTSGGSMANMVCLTVARNRMAGVDVRRDGITGLPRPLRFYVTDQSHSCHQKAVEALGLGNRALRSVATGPDLRMDPAALAEAIAEDRAAGLLPACVIATAGTTNTGAMDDLTTIGDFCRREGIWFHVDGCIGALVRISHRNAHLVRGIEKADSVALDPHKWLQTPFEAGCALVRDGQALFETFNLHPAYLEEKPRGVIAGPFLADYGLELSRGLKALKIWMSLREHGVPHFGHLIDQHIAMGAHLAARVDAEPKLETIAPVPLNIVCFRYRPDGADEARLRALNTEIMLRIQESGLAVPSDTEVRGRHALRVAINNHRTRTGDLDTLVDAVLETGAELVRDGW